MMLDDAEIPLENVFAESDVPDDSVSSSGIPQRWIRPDIASEFSASESLGKVFNDKFFLSLRIYFLALQWLEVDLTSGEPLLSNPDGGKVHGLLEGPVPIIRMYGVTLEGTSVLVCIHGFIPYFYVSLPSSMELKDSFLGELRSYLDHRMKEKARGEEKKLNKFVLGIERAPGRQSLLGYHFNETRDFIKVSI